MKTINPDYPKLWSYIFIQSSIFIPIYLRKLQLLDLPQINHIRQHQKGCLIKASRHYHRIML